MNFEELIATLSKGSATAVTTLESNVAELNALKEYLWVQARSSQQLELPQVIATPRRSNMHKRMVRCKLQRCVEWGTEKLSVPVDDACLTMSI